MNSMFTPQNGDRPSISDHVVVISDGDYPTTRSYLLELWKTAMQLRNKQISIQAVGVRVSKFLIIVFDDNKYKI